MSVLLELPETILVSIISEWNGIHELTKFNSAFCNKEARFFFIAFCISNQFAMKGLGSSDENKLGLFQNNVKCEGLKVKNPSTIFFSEFLTKPELFVDTEIVEVSFFDNLVIDDKFVKNIEKYVQQTKWQRRIFSEQLVMFLNKCCPSLRHLTLHFDLVALNFTKFFVAFDSKISCRLKTLDLGRAEVDIEVVDYISKLLEGLSTLKLKFSRWSDRVFCELIAKHGASLQSIALYGCHLTEGLIDLLLSGLETTSLISFGFDSGCEYCQDLFCKLSNGCERLVCLNIFGTFPDNLDRQYEMKLEKGNVDEQQVLSLTGSLHHMSVEFQDVLSNCVNNSTVKLYHLANLTCESLKAVSSLNPHLLGISLSGCAIPQHGGCFRSLRELFQKSTTLKTIEVALCDINAFTFVSLLVRLSSSITTLILGDAVNPPEFKQFKCVIRTNQHIQNFVISRNSFNRDKQMSDADILQSLESCTGQTTQFFRLNNK